MSGIPAVGALPGERRGYVVAGGRQIHYRERGAGSAVLLFHQAPWASVQFRLIMPLLAAAGYRAIAPDLPGHGMSDALDEPRVEGFAAIAPALLDALDVERAIFVGQHGGGVVAASAAAQFPERAAAIVLDNAPCYSAEQRAARAGAVDVSQPVVPGGAHFTDRWAWARRLVGDSWSDESIHVAVLTYFANGPTREHLHIAAPRHDLPADLARIACPGLIVAGRADSLFAHGRTIAGHRPDWDYREVDGGVASLLDAPDIWCSWMTPFLARHAGETPA